jgi:osmoprotectant transport system ATP-binding protein
MIELAAVTKLYQDIPAVEELSLKVSSGEVCVLIGPSGCGKSTTLKLVNRMLEPSAGKVLVRGRDVRLLKPELLRRQIGYVIQSIGLFPHMSVLENIAVVPRLLSWPRDKIQARSSELLELVGLDPGTYGRKLPFELSGGEAQRIGVARALAADPPILLMDEPFGAVDPLNRELLQSEFVRIQKRLKKTVLFVTHDLDEAIRLADRVALMKNGRLIQVDSPEDLLARPADGFVRSFVGSDRALKRLSRFPVADFMSPAQALSLEQDLRKQLEEVQGKTNFIWVLENQRLAGWIEVPPAGRAIPPDPEQLVTRFACSELAVSRDATLRSALSRMLGQGIKAVPVVDSQERLLGEISLKSIEAVTEEGVQP